MAMKTELPSSPYITHPQLTTLVDAKYLIEVVCKTKPHLKASVWYGEWGIQVSQQQGESVRFLVSARGSDGPHLRTFKTGYGIISFMWKLGFRNISLPMEKDGSVSHQIGSGHAAMPKSVTTAVDERAPVSLDAIRHGLLHLNQHGFTSVESAAQIIEAGYAVPETLNLIGPLMRPHTMDAMRLSDAGRMTTSIITERAALANTLADPVPEWARVVTEDYIRQKAEAGVYARDIVHARAWHTGPIEPENRSIKAPRVKSYIRRKRRTVSG